MCDCNSVWHIEDATYRGHEIVISQCNNCKSFIVDARSDNFNGGFIGGWIDNSIYNAISKAQTAVDTYELEQSLTVNIPF